MPTTFAPIPLYDPIAHVNNPRGGDRLAAYLNDPWIKYFTALVTEVDESPQRVGLVQRTAQTASIAATSVPPTVTLSTGVYRISYFVRPTTALGGTTVTVAIDWPDGGTTMTHTGSAVNGAAVTNFESTTIFAEVDANGPIRYSTTYAGAAGMQYKLTVAVELVSE